MHILIILGPLQSGVSNGGSDNYGTPWTTLHVCFVSHVFTVSASDLGDS